MGIGVSFFTEGVGAGPRKHMDILGLGMADGCELRIHPTGKAQLRLSVQTQGQGHETTFAQIVSHVIGIPPEDIEVLHGDTDNTPFGLGTYGSRSTPVSGAAAAVAAQRVRDKARIIAAAALECSADDLEWEHGPWHVKGDPDQGRTIQEIAFAAHGNLELPEGVEGHLDASVVYNPPNLTYPFGAYICVVDVDPQTGVVKVRRFIAVDDCGPRINPMIVEGQVHGGLADGIGMALMEVIAFDEDGNNLGGSFMDYLLPDVHGMPQLGARRNRHAVAAPPDRGQGRGRVGHRRFARGHRQRRPRRPPDPARRHAAHARRRSGGPCRAGRCDPIWPSSRETVLRQDLSERSAELRQSRIPFVYARVVLAERPTSAKPGDEAIILGDGTIEGFVGGTCAEATVREQSLALLSRARRSSCASRPRRRADQPRQAWSCTTRACRAARSRCSWSRRSPHPSCSWSGDAPIAKALAVDRAPPSATDVQHVRRRHPARHRRAVVVASHGRDEEDALAAALEAGVPYIGLVASARRDGRSSTGGRQ